MELSVAPDNASAVSLYRSFGFNTTKTVRDYLGPGQDRLLMTLSLWEN
jgi:ribosomal protein S18 acetylase RimI-like enzyme